MYLTSIVIAEVPSEKVILSSLYPRTSTWYPAKPIKHPSCDLGREITSNWWTLTRTSHLSSSLGQWELGVPSFSWWQQISPPDHPHAEPRLPSQSSWSKNRALVDGQVSLPPGTSLLARIAYARKESSLLQKILPKWCSALHGLVSYALGPWGKLLPLDLHDQPQGTPSGTLPSPSSPVGDPELCTAQRCAQTPCGTFTRRSFVTPDSCQSSKETLACPLPLTCLEILVGYLELGSECLLPLGLWLGLVSLGCVWCVP